MPTGAKERTMNEVLPNTLKGLEVGSPISRGRLHLFPLFGGAGEHEAALLEELLEKGLLRVEELGEGGSVPELRVVNGAPTPALILEGDELVGAKQNRVVNSSVLVAAHSELVLPVSCVERGRWSYRSRGFASGSASPHLSLRHLKSRSVHASLRRGRGHRSDQGAVWGEVDRVAHLHGAHSPTEALQDTRDGLSDRIAAFGSLSEEVPEGTRGVVVALGRRPVALEVLAGPRSFAKVFPKLLAGYALEALEQEGEETPPEPAAVDKLIEGVAQERREQHPAVGEGTDVRFEGDGITGYALVADGSILHAAAFAG